MSLPLAKATSIMKDILDSKILLYALQSLTGLLIIIGGFVFKDVYSRVQEVEKANQLILQWKAETSGNRFTSGDALAVWKEIAEIKTQIASMPKEVPPQWFVQRVDRLESSLNANGQKIEQLSSDLRSHMAIPPK